MVKKCLTPKRQRRGSSCGPVGPFLPLLASSLAEQRYTANTIRLHVAAARAFGLWLEQTHRTIDDTNEETVSIYLNYLRRGKVPPNRIPKARSALPHLLSVLRSQGVNSKPAVVEPLTECEQWLLEFDGYLSRVIGLAPNSRKRYLLCIRRFLREFCGAEMPDWTLLTAEQLTEFVTQEVSHLSRHGRGAPVTAIRTLLRYLTFKGAIRNGLEAAVPTVRRWKQAGLPKHLTTDEVARVVAGTLDGTRSPLRNHAILLMLSRLGIRAHEIRSLSLEDIDWVEGCILIRAGKSRRERLLPLPNDIGVAIYAYLEQERPSSVLRTVFLDTRAPHGPLQDSSAISKIVRRTMARVHVVNGSAAAHLLRHSAATGMLRKGVSFKAIADVLGHESLETTAIYAKLDLTALSHVAMPWPGGAA